MRKISRRLFLLLLLSACAPLPAAMRTEVSKARPTFVPRPTVTPYPTPTVPPTPVPVDVVMPDPITSCQVPIVVPAMPAVVPPPTGMDPVTGRHVMGAVPTVDFKSWKLAITGLVDHPLSLTYDDLRCMPKITETVTTTCYFFTDTASWSGVLLNEVLKKAGVQSGAKKLVQKASDGATMPVPIDMAMDAHNFLAYEMEGNPLPVVFGFPIRSIFIDVAGQYSVKWLTELEVA